VTYHQTTKKGFKKFLDIHISWIFIQLGIFLGKQLKLNGKSAKMIMTTFAFPYVSYLLYDSEAQTFWFGLATL